VILLLIGLATAIILIGIPFIIIGLILIVRGLNAPGQPIVVTVPQKEVGTREVIQRETVIQREVVKVRCQYLWQFE
jgi:hypothetical protein